MFRTGSPYSPFFTSGLLSNASPSSSRSVSPEPFCGPRRGSLPTDSTSVIEDGASAFYFTLQPKRDTLEYRSFLSLDLAESQSLRSASLRRKASNASKTSSALLRREKSFTIFPQIPETTQLALPRSSVRQRHSRDSLRSIPSPKPVPFITLPDLPTSPISAPSSPFASHSVPSLTVSRSKAPEDILTLPNRNSNATLSITPSVCKRNRSHALARLEGRTRSTRRKFMSKPIERNFMSMSDEEDEGDDSEFEDDNRRVTLSVVLEPEDVVLPPPAPSCVQGAKFAPIGGRFPTSMPSKSTSSSRKRTQPRTKDWFPLKSFIDLQGEDEMSRWSWRSFIEVVNVS